MHQQFNLLNPTGYVMHEQFNLLKPTGYVMHQHFNLLNPTAYVMHQQFNIKQSYVLLTLYLCVLYLSENKQRLVPLNSINLLVFITELKKCLLPGTNWVFKTSSLRFVFKGLMLSAFSVSNEYRDRICPVLTATGQVDGLS